MKGKLYLLSLVVSLFFAVSFAQAQVASKAQVAKQLLTSVKEADRPTDSELSAMKLSVETYSRNNGVSHVYFQQYIGDIPVFNAIMGVHITRDNKLLTYNSRFTPLKGSESISSNPALTADQAVVSAINALGLRLGTPLVQKQPATGPIRYTVFDRGNVACEDIKAQLVYQPVEKQGLRLAWQVEIYTAKATDYWVARIDAGTGQLLDKNNLVVSCDFGVADNEKCRHGFLPHKRAEDKPVFQAPFFMKNAGGKPAESDKKFSPFYNDGSSYQVYAYPVESPNHTAPLPPADARTTVANPSVTAASPFGWHDTDGNPGAEFTTTQGNNVHAYTDIDANNLPDAGSSPDGGAGLDFLFPLDLTQPPSAYRPAAVTNLFYWNNFIHDFMYGYGFDEANGNFQVNNYGNGGLGNDDVRAEAQDGSGTNNANFFTPVDGQRPRMQMYVGTTPTPDVDGDLDNLVIVHEYAHGISIRLTGGPANVSCLNNNEQMGEGWSDWYGLMMTMKPTDVGTTGRGVGTYLFGQPANGPGIRPNPYSTDMLINPITYSNLPTMAVPHGVGYVWASMIWDMTWDLIAKHGMTNGFNIAMNIVTEGMKLQPCSPGFVDGRNAIIAADQSLYGGANRCLIWTAFARRGLGFSASQGSTSSSTDGTAAFDLPPTCFVDAVPTTISVCAPTNAVATINVGDGYGGPVTLSATGNPAGTTVSFSTNPVTPVPGSSTLTIGNTGAAAPGTYTVTVSGTDGVLNFNDNFSLTIQAAAPAATTLVSPANGAVNVSNVVLNWNTLAAAETYEVQVATDAGFTNIVSSATGLTSPTYTPAGLINLTTYFWRTRAVNICGNGSYSSVFSFTTANVICGTTASTNVPVVISTSGTPTVTSTLSIASCGTITGVKVQNLNITHTFVGDLRVTLTSPLGTVVTLFDRPGVPASTFGCAGDNLAVGFDDAAILTAANFESTCGNLPAISGIYQPVNLLSGFNGESMTGTWTLTVNDLAAGDGGTLDSWQLEICSTPCVTPVITTSGTLTPFTACSGNASAEQSFTVSGTDLTANLVVTAPAGFEVSTTSGSGFGSSVSLVPSSGSVPTTTIYVRMAATATGTPSGNIACTSSGATTQNVAVSGTVNTAPTVTCPANVTVSNDPGMCSAIVNYPPATVTGSPAPTVTYSTPSGSSFPVGTTTVTVTATNSCGTATCTFTVTVNDTENPTASPVSSNFQCGAEVPPPNTAVITDEADNCGVPTVTFLPGSTTNNGGTGCAANPLIITRYYRVQDAAGNFIDVPHTITIVDNTPPVVTCPSNITVNNTPGTCGAVVNFTPTATDNCGGAVTITSVPASGSTFPVGTTNVYVTATDACGNSATCTFTVTVNDTQAPVITCPSNISVANTPNQCGAIVNYSLPTITDNCPGSTLNAPIGAANAFNGITFDITNNTTSPMTITGFTAPIGTGTHPVEVYYTTSATTAVGNEQTAANWTLLGTASVTGFGAFPNIGLVNVPIGGLVLPAGASKGIYIAVTDGSEFGYSNGDNTVTDGRLTITSSNHRGGQYPFINANIPRRFYGSVSYSYPIIPALTAGLASGSFFPVGTTTNTYQAVDAAGNTSTCSFTVTVNDVQPPSITCPANITVSNTPGTCGAVVTFAAPTVSDNCPGVTVIAVPASGSTFPVGTTTVTATATDAAGNTATCTFTVTVNDVQPPVITCPANITVNNAPGQCGASVATPNPTNTDNCAVTVRTWTLTGATTGASPLTGLNNVGTQTFNVGVTTVTYTSRDAAGNTATCTFTVTVNDVQPPVITCPANITVSNDLNLCSAVVNYALPSASDNCNKLQIPQTILPHGSGAITVAGNNLPGGFYFNVTNNSATPKTIGSLSVRFGSAAFGAVTSPAPVSVYVTTSATTYVGNQTNAGAWTAIGTGIPVTVAGPNSEFSLVPLPNGGFTLAPGQTRGMYVFGTVSSLVYNNAANSSFTPVTNGVLTITPGQASSGLFVAGLSPRTPNVILNYITLTQTAGLPSGSAFPVGTTTNTYTATDDAGNSSSCSFTVRVNDTQAPTITCPGNITVTSPAGSCTAVVSYAATANDNCPGVTVQVVSGPASGSAFPVGVTTVTLRAVDAAGNVSANCSFTVTVLDGQLPVITAQPQNRTVCAGQSATFSVTAITSPNANGPLSYQWQSWNGAAWVNITGATASSFTVSNTTLNQNTNSYRVLVTGLCTTVPSNHATLYVNPNPTVTLTTNIPPAILPTQSVTITAVPSIPGGTYQWYKNGVLIAGATSQTLGPLTVADIGSYRVVYTAPTGCTGTSADLAVTGLATPNLYVYPNPNRGQFTVQFYNQANEEVTLRIFDAKGALVYQRKYATTLPYTNINVNLADGRILTAGVYVVDVLDSGGRQIGTRRIIVYQ